MHPFRAAFVCILAGALTVCSVGLSHAATIPSSLSTTKSMIVHTPLQVRWGYRSFGGWRDRGWLARSWEWTQEPSAFAFGYYKPYHGYYRRHWLTGTTAKSSGIAPNAGTASRIALRPGPAQTHVRTAGSPAVAASDATRANIPGPYATAGAANTRTIQEQVAAATAVADRMTIATALAAIKANNGDRPNHSETAEDGDGVKAASTSANNTDVPVAVLAVGLNVRSLSKLSGKTIAIDDRYSTYSSSVRNAIVAAGADEVQLSEGQATAINRLVSREVPAAVLALVSAEAAESFPEIAGFKIFRIPFSPRSLSGRP